MICRPDRGSHISAQGRAERCEPRSAALGSGSAIAVALKGRHMEHGHMFRPYRARKSMGIRTQGDGNARHARIALPWAFMFWPLRGRNTIIRKSELQQELIVLAGVEVALSNHHLR